MNPGDLSEFVTGLHGDCGETALAEAIAAANGKRATKDDIMQIVSYLQAHQEASANGATTVTGLGDYCRANGVRIMTELDYDGDYGIPVGVWHNLLLTYGGAMPIVLEVANGQALHDIETGAADERGVKYHFVTVIGKQLDGYICCDGDNPQASSNGYGRYQIYDFGTLIAARPCGVLMLRR